MEFSSGDFKCNPSSFPDNSIPAWPWKRRNLLQDNVPIPPFSSAHENNPPPGPSDSGQTVPSTLDIREREGGTTNFGQSKQSNERVEPSISFPIIAETTQTRRKELPIHRITLSHSSTSQPLFGLGAQRSGSAILSRDVENGQIWGSQSSLPDSSEEPTTAASKTENFKSSQGTLFGSSHIFCGANEACPKRDHGLPFQFEKLRVYGELTEAPTKLTVYDSEHTFPPKENGGPLANPANAGSATHESKQSRADQDEEELEIRDDESDASALAIEVKPEDYESNGEALDPIDDPEFQKQLKLVTDQLRKLCRRMQSCQLSQDSDSKLSRICQETQKLSLFEDREERILGFIGETGAGKSSVINSILDQRGLARSSGAGSACTSVPMEYRYIDDSHPHSYTIEAEFMSETEVSELIDELLRSIWRVCGKPERSLIGDENWEQYEAIGKKSHETLEAIFHGREDLTLEYLSQPGKENEILSALKEEALRALSSRLTGSDSSQLLFVADDLEDCKEQLDVLTSGPEDSNRPALWPFIKLIRVYINLPILKHGLVLADLPGLRDTNHARVRATEKYLAAKCDEVFIVANISRCVSNESIYEIMNKCGKMKRIRIVCTKADEISPEESARGTTPFAKQVKKMNAKIKELEIKVARAARERQKAQGDEIAKLALIEAMTEDEVHQRRYERLASLMKERNESVTRDLIKAIEKRENDRDQAIIVFCVGNEIYSSPPTRLTDDHRALSGVKELQVYCRSVPAEARMLSAAAYIKNEVPALVRSLQHWCLAGRYPESSAGADELREIVDQSEISLRESFTFGQGCVSEIHKMTVAAFEGTVMLNLMRPELGVYWERLESQLYAKKDSLQQALSKLFEGIFAQIQVFTQVAPGAVSNLLCTLGCRQMNIYRKFERYFDQIFRVIRDLKQHTLYGHNHSSLIADLMRAAYNQCNMESGEGSDSRRKRIMYRHLSNNDLYERYASSVRDTYLHAVNEPLATLNVELSEQVQRLADDINSVILPTGETPETERDSEVTIRLERRLPKVEEYLGLATEAVSRLGF
ncbi:hypothetical protein N7539_000914 [Penicillium diatomitis]|uniref:G domain-containing protein n=1 Tax=Penicillium diatomitis TaxID=2819901 RepID=A0A9W9XMM0_9EURO|nr:uncharacterized protein N7539_000914 [Penicillium diatomitis]KAJ5495798.1 hypothetical protein N7539_000914 [Penicillium diatomitis]